MVNEHYVPQAYLRLFSPPDQGLISRYSLVEKHDGGDYRPPYDEYSVRKAASNEGFADGWLEQDKVTLMEDRLIRSLEKLPDKQDPLDEEDIACLSLFVAFQHDRTPESKLHFEGRQYLGPVLDNRTNVDGLTLDQGWDSILAHNINGGHQQLQFMGWRLVKNTTETPFITSDRPVTHNFCLDYEDVRSTTLQNEGREIYCPINPDHALVLLDPCWYDVTGQYPKTEIQQLTIDERDDIHEINRLQTLTAFQETFGPVGHGDYLEQIVEGLCEEFPDEDFIRGNRVSIEALQLAQYLASRHAYLPVYREHGKPIIRARQKKTHAIWEFEHDISFVKELRREQPNRQYWESKQPH